MSFQPQVVHTFAPQNNLHFAHPLQTDHMLHNQPFLAGIDNYQPKWINSQWITKWLQEKSTYLTFPPLKTTLLPTNNLLNETEDSTNWGLRIGMLLLLQDEIIVTRPLKELASHIRHLQMPRIELIARVIKTLVLSIFRWHLCDQCLLKQGEDRIIHNLTYLFTNQVSVMNRKFFESSYPYMLENAYILTPKPDVTKKKDNGFISYDNVSPDAIRVYFEQCYEIKITDKLQGNSINDLFKSKSLGFKTTKS